MFIAVCRGKLSEGIDFLDNAARCVVVAGIPYPLLTDPRIVTKRDYLDRKFAHGKSKLNGNGWYKLQACRAVNQAIGRVIRHAGDFGAIILLDERYNTHKVEVSKWLNSRKRLYTHFPELERDLQAFFLRHGCTSADIPEFKTAKLNTARLAFTSKRNGDRPVNIRYEYDIPKEEEEAGTVTIVEMAAFQPQARQAGAKRQFGVLGDYDEGEPFVERLDFASNTGQPDKVESDKVESPKKGPGGYKRRAYRN